MIIKFNRLKYRQYYCMLLLLAIGFAARSQKAEMYPDRPDQTEEVHTVSKKHLQLESGLIVNRFDSGRSAIINRTILRYGLSDRFEIGLLTEQGRDRNRYLDETVQSSYPVAMRLKTILLKEHAWLPDITLVNYLQLPFAHDDSGKRANTSLAVLVAFLSELSEKWRLDYTAGFQQEAFSKKIAWQVYTSIHYEISDKLESFLGSYSQFQKEEQPFHNLNIGLAYLLQNNLQIDVALGSSVDHADGNQFVTVGFAYLF